MTHSVIRLAEMNAHNPYIVKLAHIANEASEQPVMLMC